MTAKVKWINDQQGYGFIYGAEGGEYFFFITSLGDGRVDPEKLPEEEVEIRQEQDKVKKA